VLVGILISRSSTERPSCCVDPPLPNFRRLSADAKISPCIHDYQRHRRALAAVSAITAWSATFDVFLTIESLRQRSPRCLLTRMLLVDEISFVKCPETKNPQQGGVCLFGVRLRTQDRTQNTVSCFFIYASGRRQNCRFFGPFSSTSQSRLSWQTNVVATEANISTRNALVWPR